MNHGLFNQGTLGIHQQDWNCGGSKAIDANGEVVLQVSTLQATHSIILLFQTAMFWHSEVAVSCTLTTER